VSLPLGSAPPTTTRGGGVRVLVAPDGFGGVLSAAEVAEAVGDGWRRARPGDEVRLLPLSDGGEGLLDVVAAEGDRLVDAEVAGPHGHPVRAPLLLRRDGTAIVESARACGLALVPPERRSPMPATTYGVGQLIDRARELDARRVVVGLGGSASVDGGTGALNGLGFRLRVEDGSGLKVGGADLHRVRRVEPTWVGDFSGVRVVLLADVDATLSEAAPMFGPQKGATPEQVAGLDQALSVWADVAERDLAGGRRLRDEPGSGAAGGLGFGLAAGLGATLVDGAAGAGELVGLEDALGEADLVVTGEGRLDLTSLRGKVVGHLLRRAGELAIPLHAVVGVADPAVGHVLTGIEEASPEGPGPDPAGDVVEAAHRLAHAVSSP
jgi:glycerate 2-kinase